MRQSKEEKVARKEEEKLKVLSRERSGLFTRVEDLGRVRQEERSSPTFYTQDPDSQAFG
jgi:hypothetical protein